jgi:hypothetical protein
MLNIKLAVGRRCDRAEARGAGRYLIAAGGIIGGSVSGYFNGEVEQIALSGR